MDVVCTCNAYVEEFKLFKEKISSKQKALLLRNIFQDQSTSPFTYIGTNIYTSIRNSRKTFIILFLIF